MTVKTLMIFFIVITMVVVILAACDSPDPFSGQYTSFNFPTIVVNNLRGDSSYSLTDANLPYICTPPSFVTKVCGEIRVDDYFILWKSLSSTLSDVVCTPSQVIGISNALETKPTVRNIMDQALSVLDQLPHLACIQDCEHVAHALDNNNNPVINDEISWTTFGDLYHSQIRSGSCGTATTCGAQCGNMSIPQKRLWFTESHPTTGTSFIINNDLTRSYGTSASRFSSSLYGFYPASHPIITSLGQLLTWPLVSLQHCQTQFLLFGVSTDTAGKLIISPDLIFQSDEQAHIASSPVLDDTSQFTYYDFSSHTGFTPETEVPCSPFDGTTCGAGLHAFMSGCHFPEIVEMGGDVAKYSNLSIDHLWCLSHIHSNRTLLNQFMAFYADFSSRITELKSCVIYGDHCKDVIEPNTQDKMFFYGCRLHNTQIFTRATCSDSVTFCPWPTCEFEKTDVFIPDFVTIKTSPKLHYEMPREVQCFMTHGWVNIPMPNYVCEETLGKSAMPSLSYICDENNSGSQSLPSSTTTPPKCCTGFLTGSNCDQTPDFHKIAIYPGSLSYYGIIVDGVTSIPDLFEATQLPKASELVLTLPPETDVYSSAPSAFTLVWEYDGPPTRFTILYVTPSVSGEDLFPFPVLLARVPATVGYYTFSLEQAEFAALFNFAELNANRDPSKKPVGFADITHLTFTLVSTARFKRTFGPIPTTFGCRHNCVTERGACDRDTGECKCYNGHTSGSHCSAHMCNQIHARYTFVDQIDVSGTTPFSYLSDNWYVCQLAMYKWIKNPLEVQHPCHVFHLKDDTPFVEDPNNPVPTEELYKTCDCDLGEGWFDFNTGEDLLGPNPPPLESRGSKFCNTWAKCEEWADKPCANGGYHEYTFTPRYPSTQFCQEKCTCTNNWSSESNCEICGLKCQHGTSNSDCTQCVCDTIETFPPDTTIPADARRWFGDSCQCAIAMEVSVEFPTIPPEWAFVQDAFISSVINDLISDTQIPFQYWFFNRHVIINDPKTSAQTFRLHFDLVLCENDNFAGVLQGLSDYYDSRRGLLPLDTMEGQDYEKNKISRKNVFKHLSFVYTRVPHYNTNTANNTKELPHFNSVCNFVHSSDIMMQDDEGALSINQIYIQSSNDMVALQNDNPGKQSDLWNLWNNKNNNQESTLPVDESQNGSYADTGLAQEYAGGKVTKNPPDYANCNLLFCPPPPRSSSSNIGAIVAIPIVVAILFIIFLVSLCYCRSKKILFFKPTQKKSKNNAQNKNMTEHTETICSQCKTKHVNSSASKMSVTTATSQSSMVSRSSQCTSCHAELNPSGVEMTSKTAVSAGIEIHDGEQMPPGWCKMQSPNGKVFYYHKDEMKTSWNNPLKDDFDNGW